MAFNLAAKPNRWLQALRWITVLPGSIVALFAAAILVTIQVWIAEAFLGEIWFGVISWEAAGELLKSWASPLAFVFAAAYIAPNMRFYTAVVAMLLMVLLTGFSLATHVMGVSEGWWPTVLANNGLSIVGAVMGTYYAYQFEQENRSDYPDESY